MKKVLLIATVVQKHINVFHLPVLKMFQEEGYRTYVAAENDTESQEIKIPYCDEFVQISFKRNPLHPGNISAYIKLRKLIQKENFDIIHCHTPVGGVLGRIAAKKARKKGTKVFYTAHGFHFYKGAPLLNWLIYYPIEKLCAHFTDVLITINQEDFSLARKKMKAKRIEYVPGVGIDMSRFENVNVDRNVKRQEIGIPEDAILITSVGELSVRKNHRVIIQALTKIDDQNIHYVIAGNGLLLSELQTYAKEQGIAKRIHFLGYRSDITEIYNVSDICCLPSIHEGLPVALMEGMASNLPCITSRIRGNIDLINEKSGFLVDTMDIDGYVNAILALTNNVSMRIEMGTRNREYAYQYSIDAILEKMKTIYEG